MTVNEKFISMLSGIQDKGLCEAVDVFDTGYTVSNAKVAEHLIKNGATVQPCNIGDTVYVVFPSATIGQFTVTSATVKRLQYIVNEVDASWLLDVTQKDRHNHIFVHTVKLGKKAFLTEQEANWAAEKLSKK